MPRRFLPLVLLAAAVLPCSPAIAAAPAPDLAIAAPRPLDPMDAAELRIALRKLQVLGTALFVAAHPDDENSSLLSYLSNGRLVRAAYLSLTRGDGGQNLIGSETGVDLGVIRTHELLAARRVDGAEQYFTRALDFGFSKNPEETLEIWDHDRILADVVWVIRRLRPDVIVTRFPPDSTAGHGHHTASGMLAEEAFVAAADPKRFPEQLATVRPWQARRLVWNVFRFASMGPDTTRGRLRLDLGEYNPLLGRAYTEIAGRSRSMHKSQGFGAAERRGAWDNTFEHKLGERAAKDLFDGVDLGWTRVTGGAKVGALLKEAERGFVAERPSAILPVLLKARAAMAELPDEPIVRTKRRELAEVIRSCAGLWIEATAARPSVVPGQDLPVTITVLNRSPGVVALVAVTPPFGASVRLAGGAKDAPAAPAKDLALEPNRPRLVETVLPIPADFAISQPYWLRERPRPGSFEVADATQIGDPEDRPALAVRAFLAIGGERLTVDVPVIYRWVDPVQGERYRAVAIAPPATVRFDHGVYLFPDARPRPVRVIVEAADSTRAATVRLRLPDGWSAAPAEGSVRFAGNEREQSVRFLVTPGPEAGSQAIAAIVETPGRSDSYRRVQIDHPHIPLQTFFAPAEARLVHIGLARSGEHIGYVMGSGDQVPEALAQMGFQVTLLSDDDIEGADLRGYDAIVVGVRAYNTRPRLKALQPRLLDWVAGGGHLVVQYQTAEEGLGERLGPFPFKISRDRVTVETAEMRLLAPDHPLLQTPNRIVESDFAGWVQERGLYFANPWDPKYETIFSANDPGETPKAGGLLFARHGKGTFVYTGLAWFRQLPAGVPGAWRLFANLVSRPARS